jgi:preprotein translocase subunit SecD
LTLFIGVLVSMFTAITVSRTLLQVVVSLGLTNPRWWFSAAPPSVQTAPAD